MQFKLWLETDERPSIQQIFPVFTQEDPPNYKKISRYSSKDAYVKAQMRGGKKTELSAEKMAGAPFGDFFSGADEQIEKIWRNALTVPAHKFTTGQVRPEMKIHLVHLMSKEPMPNGKYRHRLLAYYGGTAKAREEHWIDRNTLAQNTWRTPIAGLIMMEGYITHAWVDKSWRGREPGGFSLFEAVREFARMYLGVHGTHPDDDLTSKSYRGAQAKYDYNRYLQWKQAKTSPGSTTPDQPPTSGA